MSVGVEENPECCADGFGREVPEEAGDDDAVVAVCSANSAPNSLEG